MSAAAERTNGGAARQLDLGGVRVTLLDGGALRLDGGAMFGIIPKAMWARVSPPDESNRIALACNCLLVEWDDAPQRRLIVETGVGAKYGEKEQRIFALDPRRWLRPALLAHGVAPETITDVVVTHLHFDHAGGLTWMDGAALVPTFPRARVHVQRLEYADAQQGFGVMTATYRRENLAPLDEAGRWSLVDGEAEIAPGVSVRPLPGHTRGHQGVVIRGAARTVVFAGDLLPTAQHAGLPYNMGYDLYPVDNMETKRGLLAEAAAGEWWLVLDHEPRTPVVRVEEREGVMGLVAV